MCCGTGCRPNHATRESMSDRIVGRSLPLHTFSPVMLLAISDGGVNIACHEATEIGSTHFSLRVSERWMRSP
jgi:hypothetical protein